MTESVDCGPVIIGAGAIGLAIANEMSSHHDDIVLLDAESSFGYHTSSRNSEVIHSGIYYAPGSLKSELCLKGNRLLYGFLKENNLPYNRCGKLIISDRSHHEQAALEALKKNADIIGLDYAEVSHKSHDLASLPLKPFDGILLQDTGFFDSHEFMQTLEHKCLSNGVTVSYNTKVSDISKMNDIWQISINDGEFRINTRCIINSAGLTADRISDMAGFSQYKIFFYKGEYYKTSKLKDIKHLIYSVPPANQMSLGIHTRNYMDGSIGFGPNAYPVEAVDYRIDDSNKSEFLQEINKYVSTYIGEDDIHPDYSGIRPKVNSGGIKSDFLIVDEDCDENRRFISLVGIESPGLTCSLSIAEYVTGLL